MGGMNLKTFCSAIFFATLIAAPMLAQQAPAAAPADKPAIAAPPASEASAPSGQPGMYVQDSTGWHLLAQNMQYKAKLKHGFVSGLTYGAVAAPMVVEYQGLHAAVQINATQPKVCAYRLMIPSAPLLVRLKPKKQTRELDSGSLRAVPLVGQTKEVQASASSLVPTTTLPSTAECLALVQPQAALAPGEYAVMIGTQNIAIMDFGVAAQ